jgi:hypothetical protein
MTGGTNVIVTLHLQEVNNSLKLIAKPINKKLPHLEIVSFMGQHITYENFVL